MNFGCRLDSLGLFGRYNYRPAKIKYRGYWAYDQICWLLSDFADCIMVHAYDGCISRRLPAAREI